MNQLKADEGTKKANGLHVPFSDHLGYITIGYGILLDDRKGGGLTEEEAEYLLMNRIQARLEALQDRIAFWDDLTENRQIAFLNMSYQLGVNGLLAFKKMMKAAAIGHWDRVYTEAMDSRWAKQTPERARRIALALKNG